MSNDIIFSVIIPAYNAAATLPKLLASLAAQTYRRPFEVIVVDDNSDDTTAEIATSVDCRLIRLTENRGPAYCRNIGVRNASGKILIFTDSDCNVDREWLERIDGCFSLDDTDCVMGRLVLLPSGLLGDSISALGFPAGGSLGFEKIWYVNDEGYTNSLSSCNFAIKRHVLAAAKGFDESFPYAGGEDSVLAYRLIRMHYRIKYCPNVVAYHPARDTLQSFARWQFKRGISSFIFSKKVARKKDFVSLRMWSTQNIIKYNWLNKEFPLVVFLLGMSFLLQGFGFLRAKHSGKFS